MVFLWGRKTIRINSNLGEEAYLPNGEPGIELSNMKQLEKAVWEVGKEKNLMNFSGNIPIVWRGGLRGRTFNIDLVLLNSLK